MQSPADRDARIRDRAYQLWVSEGRHHGRHDAHWQQAERDIEAEDAAAAGETKTSARSARTSQVPVTSEANPPTVRRARAKDETTTKKTPTRAATAATSDAGPTAAERTNPTTRPRRSPSKA